MANESRGNFMDREDESPNSNGDELPAIKVKELGYYKMDNTHRGHAFIFNHIEFTEEVYREGSDLDEKRLRVILDKLGFNVESYTDLTLTEIHEVIKKAQKYKYESDDCFVMAVLSHGSSASILKAKDYDYPLEDLWKPFTDDKCPSLKGKPRLFFVQACRGLQVTNPVLLEHRTEKDCTPQIFLTFQIPEHFLIAFSTSEGYLSWRSRSGGSVFIKTLCEALEKYVDQYDLNHILTLVSRKIAIEFETRTPEDKTRNEMKQMPCFVTTLTRLLSFRKET